MEEDIQQHLHVQQYTEAFDLLVERFKDKVFRLSYSILHEESLAEDTTQDVFIRIWKALPNYQGSASLSTWIYTIARNTSLTELKKRNSHPTVSLHAPEMEGTMDVIPALRTTDRESGTEMDVQTMLAELPEKYRQVIVLFYLEQKAYEEVAAMLSIPLGTVKTLLFRAKREFLRIASRASTKSIRADSPVLPGRALGTRLAFVPKPVISTLTQ